MQVKEIMTADPACCVPEDSLETAVKLMIDFDCGEIPVVDDRESLMTVGVITDRDVACLEPGRPVAGSCAASACFCSPATHRWDSGCRSTRCSGLLLTTVS